MLDANDTATFRGKSVCYSQGWKIRMSYQSVWYRIVNAHVIRDKADPRIKKNIHTDKCKVELIYQLVAVKNICYITILPVYERLDPIMV